jgi:3-hydroxyacyl-[acyl-carrier-protein] dehydratase
MSETTAALEVGSAIDMAEILGLIPHRYPFLLIDRAEDYRPSQSITGFKCVTMNEPFFPGHFPENPVMPGVLIMEAMAQTGAVLMSKSLRADVTNRTIMFMSVDNARFRSPVRPGMVLRMDVKVLRHRGDVYKFRGEARVDGKLAAEAEWGAMVVDNAPQGGG